MKMYPMNKYIYVTPCPSCTHTYSAEIDINIIPTNTEEIALLTCFYCKFKMTIYYSNIIRNLSKITLSVLEI